jgi:hypothetical protein
LIAFPHLVEEKSITLATLLAAADLAEARQRAIAEAVESAISKKMLGKPAGWFTYLRENLGSTATKTDSERFIERKAARDVLEHHNGIVDASYLSKAGSAAAFSQGHLIEPDDVAINELYNPVTRLINAIAGDAERALSQRGAK